MLGIGLGYFPDEVLRLRYNDVIDQITAPSLRQYITENTDFDQDPNPYILGKKFGGYYASDFHLAQVARADRKKIGMDITLQNLRLSYVYSILNQEDLTDKELKKILRVNSKTLFSMCCRREISSSPAMPLQKETAPFTGGCGSIFTLSPIRRS